MGLTKMKEDPPRAGETTMKMIDTHQDHTTKDQDEGMLTVKDQDAGMHMMKDQDGGMILIEMKDQDEGTILIEMTEADMDLLEVEEMNMNQGAWIDTAKMDSMMTGVHRGEAHVMTSLIGCMMKNGAPHQEAQEMTLVQCMMAGRVHPNEAPEMITTEIPQVE